MTREVETSVRCTCIMSHPRKLAYSCFIIMGDDDHFIDKNETQLNNNGNYRNVELKEFLKTSQRNFDLMFDQSRKTG